MFWGICCMFDLVLFLGFLGLFLCVVILLCFV